jgi:ABC-type Mn2+/Zn2+ transport system permease subunit
MLGRRMALVAGPLGHLTLPGVALALMLGIDVSVGAFPIVLLGAAIIWWLEARTRLPMEALTALVFATGVSIAFLLLPVAQAEAALVGDISRTTPTAAVVTVLLCGAVTLLVRWRYGALVLVNVSEDLATSAGVTVRRHNLLYLALIAVIVALGAKVVGGLLTAALVAIPASTARNVARDLRQYARTAAATGMLSAIIGILVGAATGWPAGPLVVLASATLFTLSVFVGRAS